jgi:hypothetical protein
VGGWWRCTMWQGGGAGSMGQGPQSNWCLKLVHGCRPSGASSVGSSQLPKSKVLFRYTVNQANAALQGSCHPRPCIHMAHEDCCRNEPCKGEQEVVQEERRRGYRVGDFR